MERMNTLDAGFYFADSEQAPLHIASITVLEGPPPSREEMLGVLTAKLPKVPRYRQRVRTVPLNLDLPVWVDDPRFRLSYHLRHTALPSPGGRQELQNLVGRIMSQRLDPTRPLWEMWVVEGLAGGQWALIAKVHHCVVDGVGGSDLLTALFDLEPLPAPAAARPPGPGEESAPSRLALAINGLGQSVAVPAGALARRLTRLPALGRPDRLREAREFTEGLPQTVQHITRPPVPSLRGPTGPHRRWIALQTELDRVKAVRRELGCTVNDIILAAVTCGFRELLGARGELEDDTTVRSLVPVSVRTDGQAGELGNRVSALVVELPCGERDPIVRVAQLHGQMAQLKQTHQAAGADALVRLAGTAPTMLSLASRAVITVMRTMFQTVTTNVPGPQFPLYIAGRRVTALYPYVPIAAGAGISTGIFSYMGHLCFGVTGDFDTTPDLQTFVNGIATGLDELAAAIPNGR
ncbi:WS/DGAT/MGAT family O-acyltransferase [Thermomonospora curvata]|uniref:Diacylglycerol O-acyltransferase n=1 Tax=Thermomonospora curvata (strain ATCC 19995 / DSM 43183 / JCM 3096 / KCTC 9072 / NBRC 15933 / NCIMB 10081 / Henssen B9) TaxID=471852 RepID=D1A3H6_THECD|nr:wax ester/triacylglycerol synthase family O-acyltransferase [Thermomonospora curvata]ACY96101.1 acyltransferase, WS/DGAT/MGAT [Thermomonospora curvata DSM 43183]